MAAESPPREDPSADEVFKILFGGVVLIRGNLLMGLRPMAPAGGRFDPDRVGLDHLSFGVPTRDDLEQAVRCPTRTHRADHPVRRAGLNILSHDCRGA